MGLETPARAPGHTSVSLCTKPYVHGTNLYSRYVPTG